MKTPIQELIDLIRNNKLHSKLDILAECYILKEKEKQQFIGVAIEFGMHGEEMMQERGEQYYNETYGTHN